uniref:Uncharacterized protein n=1 Tax=Haptolina ericina TaxID=156174 RepID=A0A7S3BP89_9EUKA|mmetsp:Transcript_65022/g.145225  ORF Transcript_65022/g.145225 Transcript_65022/m.145225 type:complete len:236 (+) Transcript_65022:78-785(+)
MLVRATSSRDSSPFARRSACPSGVRTPMENVTQAQYNSRDSSPGSPFAGRGTWSSVGAAKEQAERLQAHCNHCRECNSVHWGTNSEAEDGITALIRASYEGRAECIDMLINMGVPVDQADTDGHTALHAACAFGHAHCTALLLKAHARVNTLDHQGATALHAACMAMRPSAGETVPLLLNARADPWLIFEGRTALAWAQLMMPVGDDATDYVIKLLEDASGSFEHSVAHAPPRAL